MINTETTSPEITTITQLSKASEVLKGLSVNVTTQDRRDAEKKFNISRFTTTAYLNGNAKDLDQAMKLIEFFQQKIGYRERKLSA